MEPEEFSRVIGQILGSGPVSMADRNKVNNAMGEADSVEEMPEDVQQILIKLQDGAASRSAEKRASRTSTVERRIVKQQNICERCRLNEDPDNVPVHPNCDCDVITDTIESGVADSQSRFLQVLHDSAIEMQMVGDEIAMPQGIQLDPETAAILDGENVRFSDLARWLETMQPYLDQGAQFLSIVVDDDTSDAVDQAQQVIEAADEGFEDFSEAIRSRKLWFALAKAVAF